MINLAKRDKRRASTVGVAVGAGAGREGTGMEEEELEEGASREADEAEVEARVESNETSEGVVVVMVRPSCTLVAPAPTRVAVTSRNAIPG